MNAAVVIPQKTEIKHFDDFSITEVEVKQLATATEFIIMPTGRKIKRVFAVATLFDTNTIIDCEEYSSRVRVGDVKITQDYKPVISLPVFANNRTVNIQTDGYELDNTILVSKTVKVSFSLDTTTLAKYPLNVITRAKIKLYFIYNPY